jgi:hypothetical protein
MIDLAMKYNMADGPVEIDKDDVHYPTFHYESKKKVDFPEEGEMTIKFKKVRSEHSSSDRGERYSCTIEVREIVDMEGEKINEPKKSSAREAEDALDAIAVVVANKRNNNSKSESGY